MAKRFENHNDPIRLSASLSGKMQQKPSVARIA